MKLIPEIRKIAEHATDAAYKFIEERLLLSDSRPMKWSLNLLEKTYDIASSRRKYLEVKRLKLVLLTMNRLRAGALMLVKQEITTRTDISIDNLAERKWVTIPSGEYVMYLNVAYDENYDVPTLQILWKDRVVYLHHDNRVGEDFVRLEEILEVVRAK